MLVPEKRSNKSYDFSKEKYQSPSGIMLHSRTVVEKDNYVATGVLTYAEGDVLEVELNEYKAFQLSENVKLTVYSPGGVYTFQSTVIAKDQGSLMFINPPQNKNRFVEKREHPRVDVSHRGHMLSYGKVYDNEQVLEQAVEIDIHNISVSGIGFSLASDIELNEQMKVQVNIDLGFEIPCLVEIIRKQKRDDSHYYGAQYVELPSEKTNSLRAFVLKKQVEQHFGKKNEEKRKRVFK
ncbi:flagellar brake protein [Paenibacillus sp. YYML68]|uniref:flagellar brake protein n=1 Tax=Paenibacillus sp. YYML68 TaxID=2909250 RepID=UPI002490A366|nr:PilZ domain-containing protein [Paenibacillus sp. YYML68]